MRAVFLAFCLCGVSAAAPVVKWYEVTFEVQPGGDPLRYLNVTFFVPPPGRETVDRIVRESLEHAALLDPSVDILGFAFNGEDDALAADEQWSGPFVWDSITKKVVRLSDRQKSPH